MISDLLFQMLLNLLSSLLLVSRIASFVVRENTIEGEQDILEKQEVRVTYGDELENILRKAASEGRQSLVEEILNGEVSDSHVGKQLSCSLTFSDPRIAKLGEEESI